MSQSQSVPDFPRTLADMKPGTDEHFDERERLRSLSLAQRRRQAVQEYDRYLEYLDERSEGDLVDPETQEIFAHAYEMCAAALTHLRVLADDADAHEDVDNWNVENQKLAKKYGMAYSMLTADEFEQFKALSEEGRVFLSKFFRFYGSVK